MLNLLPPPPSSYIPGTFSEETERWRVVSAARTRLLWIVLVFVLGVLKLSSCNSSPASTPPTSIPPETATETATSCDILGPVLPLIPDPAGPP